MIESNEIISKKVKWNAISAYLLIFISWLFFFNKSNDDINNNFVKSHTLSAFLIHIWFLITYIIFISNSLFAWIEILWFWLNDIITIIIYLFLLSLIILWIYKANKWERLNLSNEINISKIDIKKIVELDLDGDWNVSEKEKLTIILSFIPLIGFISYWKYKNNKIIQDSTRLNIIASLIILLLYIFSYSNIANLLSLWYIILVIFIWVNLFSRNELLQIKLPEFLSPEKAYLWLCSCISYFKNYFKNDEDFISFKEINNKIIEEQISSEITEELNLNSKKEIKIPKVLIYIPIINLIFLFIKNTKYSFHIINWLLINFLLILTIFLEQYWIINSKIHLLLILPILFWMWYIKYRLAYKMPIIFDIYTIFKNILLFLSFSKKTIKEKKAEENEISLKVK